MSTDGVSSQEGTDRHPSLEDDSSQPEDDDSEAEIVDLLKRNYRRSRSSMGRPIKLSRRFNDAIPIGVGEDGEPVYVRTELDQRYEAWLGAYDHALPHSEQVLISDAFFAIIAPENLTHADEAVKVLWQLVERAKRRTHYQLTRQPEELEAQDVRGSGALSHPDDDDSGWRA